MTDFATTWTLSRQRFDDEVKDLTQEQLRWPLAPFGLSIGQMAIHLAGVEMSFTTQLLGETLTPEDQKLKLAATEGVVNDNPFPYSEEEITPASVQDALNRSRAKLGPLIANPSPEILAKQIKSALGPIIDGQGAFARMSFHPAYHQGQAYLLKTHPNFPK
jgi:hypothetical protein